MMRLRVFAGLAIVIVVALAGCGGSGGISKDDLAQSVLESSEVFVAENGKIAEANLEGAVEELGKPAADSQVGPYIFHLGKEACQDPRSNQPAPKGENAVNLCFVHYQSASGKQSEEVEMEVSIFSINGQCWKGTLIGLNVGVGTPEYREEAIPQNRIDSGAEDLHGCVGEQPGAQGPTTSGEVAKAEEERAAEVQPEEEATSGDASAGDGVGSSEVQMPPEGLKVCGTISFPPGQSERRSFSTIGLSCDEAKTDVEQLISSQVPEESNLPAGWTFSNCHNFEGSLVYCTREGQTFALSAPTAFFLSQ